MSFSVDHGTDDHDGSSASTNKPVNSFDIETIRMQLSALAARLQTRVSMETLRPLPVFLGITPTAMCLSAGAFTPPVRKMDKSSYGKIRSRIKLNLAYFLSNYALVAVAVGVVVALMHPSMLLFLAACAGLWSLHSLMIRQEVVVFGLNIGNLLSIQQRFYLIFTITSIVVILKCLGPTLIFLLISSLLIVTHAFLRDPKHIDQSAASMLGAQDSDDEEDLEGNNSGGSSGSEIMVDRPRRSQATGDAI